MIIVYVTLSDLIPCNSDTVDFKSLPRTTYRNEMKVFCALIYKTFILFLKPEFVFLGHMYSKSVLPFRVKGAVFYEYSDKPLS